MKSPRKPISKSLRFEVFSRDGYTCRYCGRNPSEVKLVIDHVIPVSKGGENGKDNLATSCSECNSGKGVKPANPPDTGDAARMSRLQELKEQEETSRAATRAVKARQKFRQTVIDAWCTVTGRADVDVSTINVIVGYVEHHGMNQVLRWIEKAYIKCGWSDKSMGKYVSGIRRCTLEEQQ